MNRRFAVWWLLVAALAAGGCSSFDRSRLPDSLAPATPEISQKHATIVEAERVQLTRDYLAIHNPKLAEGLSAANEAATIRFDPRVIVVHYTAIPTLAGTLDAFRSTTIGSYRQTIRQNGRLNVGIHYVVDRDGSIYRLYPDDLIARHVIGLNHVAIGIENVGDGDLDERGAEAPLTEAQLEANRQLVRYLKTRYPGLEYLVGHSEYRQFEKPRHPGHHLFYEERPEYRTEKVDPGRKFLRRLRRLLRRDRP